MFSIFRRKPYAQEVADGYMARAAAAVDTVNDLHQAGLITQGQAAAFGFLAAAPGALGHGLLMNQYLSFRMVKKSQVEGAAGASQAYTALQLMAVYLLRQMTLNTPGLKEAIGASLEEVLTRYLELTYPEVSTAQLLAGMNFVIDQCIVDPNDSTAPMEASESFIRRFMQDLGLPQPGPIEGMAIMAAVPAILKGQMAYLRDSLGVQPITDE